MLQNFWKTSDQALNIDNIVSIYKQVMRKAVVTWNEEMLQEMDVVNANEYLEMRQSMMWKFYKGTHLCYPQLIHNNHYNCTRHNIFYIQHTDQNLLVSTNFDKEYNFFGKATKYTYLMKLM